MVVTFNEVQSVLDTLPIGYYLGRNLDVKLSDEDTCYDPMNDIVYISFPQIFKRLYNVETNVDIEYILRHLLYHEVSHALLTPKEMTISDVVNIVEDQRIETVMKDFYMKVDFEEFCKFFNDYTPGQQPQSFMKFFYNIVRFHEGPEPLVKMSNYIINQFQNLTRRNMYSYTTSINELVENCKEFWNDAENKPEDNPTASLASCSFGHWGSCFEDVIAQSLDFNDEWPELPLRTIDELKQDICETLDRYNDPKLQEQFDQILSTVKKVNKATSSAINAYSGVFNPRSVVRDDYKWFVQQNRSGHVKQFAKIKLNLFIDCSGSFAQNDETVNKLLKCLVRLEHSNPNFEFDLIRCGEGQHLAPKNKRLQNSDEGTHLTADVVNVYQQVQDVNAQNYNIVLYDGDIECALYDEREKMKEASALRIFDNRSTVLIMDSENCNYCKRYIKTAKVVISNHYTMELTRNILSGLYGLVRV